LENLRPGVEKAIASIGAGLVSHKANQSLRSKLSSGQLPTQEFYRQILRIIYRMLFLFVAEDRGLLHPPLPKEEAGKERIDSALRARRRYRDFYSIGRLRDLTLHRAGTSHPDLWQVSQLITRFLGSDTGSPELALPALGSFLWSPESTSDLNDCQVSNRHFLEAVHALAFIRDGNIRRAIDYKNLGAEELGSVYESLLELHPLVNADAGTFELKTAAGHERKTTGSYYTDDSLVQSLLDTSLEPVIAERLQEVKQMANSEWRMVIEPYRGEFIHYASQKLSRTGIMAAGPGNRQGSVSSDQEVPEGGTLRNDLSNPAGSDFDTGQYSRGMGQTLPSRVHTVLAQSERELNGTRNASDRERGRGNLSGISDPGTLGRDRNSGQTTPCTGTKPPTEAEIEALWKQTPFGTRYSLFASIDILSLKICDLAVGSGHFLIGAAHRLARRVAAARTGEEEPSPEATRSALRDVIGRCLYGVDINPMAAELCRVSLWLEALEPGKPLSFLDHHIRVGNSLLGATPELIAKGIPDDAYKPIEGDDRNACAILKKRNRGERSGIGGLFIAEDKTNQEALRQAAFTLESIQDDTPEAVHQKAEAFEKNQHSYDYLAAKRLADAWCAAFVIQKNFNPGTKEPTGLTQRHLRELAKGNQLPSDLGIEIERLSSNYRFFHWHLAFPEIFANGGFCVILGNPPWENIKADPVEFFATVAPNIVAAPTAEVRAAMIEELSLKDLNIRARWDEHQRFIAGQQHLISSSGCYPFGAHGKCNTMPLFLELFAMLTSPRGRAGIIVKSVIGTDTEYQPLFQHIVEAERIASFWDFINEHRLFPDVHRQERFALITLSPRKTSPYGFYAFRLESPSDLSNRDRVLMLTGDDLRAMANGSCRLPTVTEPAQMRLLIVIARHCRATYLSVASCVDSYIMLDGGKVPSAPGFCTVDNFSPDCGRRAFGKNSSGEEVVAVYEGKLFGNLDHRYRTFEGISSENRYGKTPATNTLTDEDKDNPHRTIEPRYWVSRRFVIERLHDRDWRWDWLVLHSRKGNRDNYRTFSVALVPICASVDVSPIILPRAECVDFRPVISAAAAGQSIVFDYLVRLRLVGFSIGKNLLEEIPAPGWAAYMIVCKWERKHSVFNWLLPRVLELSYCAWDLEPMARDCGYPGPPFRWDEERRFLLRCELDSAFFHLFLPGAPDGQWMPARSSEGTLRDDIPDGLVEIKHHFPNPRNAVAYIMDSFNSVRRKDQKKHGEYRTKRVILEIYDEMAEAIRTGIPYKTRLNPPPGPPADEKGNFLPLPEWPPGQPKPANWPSHIHLPKKEYRMDTLRPLLGKGEKGNSL
jgi:hypothetical protein